MASHRSRENHASLIIFRRRPAKGYMRTAGRRRRRPAVPEHDPEKWKPVFRKDHAQTKI
jgi:hypothetical protein